MRDLLVGVPVTRNDRQVTGDRQQTARNDPDTVSGCDKWCMLSMVN